MPTILIINGFRFFFYSNEHLPIHIHIEKDTKTAKFKIEEIELVKSRGFNAAELKCTDPLNTWTCYDKVFTFKISKHGNKKETINNRRKS